MATLCLLSRLSFFGRLDVPLIKNDGHALFTMNTVSMATLLNVFQWSSRSIFETKSGFATRDLQCYSGGVKVAQPDPE